MTYKIESIGKAMTALAAVLAFSSTSLSAQETSTQPPPAANTATTEPAESGAPPMASPPSLSPIEKARQAGTPAAAPVPPPSEFDQLMSDFMADDTVPFVIAGATGLGLLTLLGTGILTRRRKLRREREDLAAKHRLLAEADTRPPVLELDRAHEVRPGPAYARRPSPMHDPVPGRKVPVTKLPSGFDLSRFGPNVQAAYLGPTPDNPSLSLKYRLRRAMALDQQARRRAAEAPATVPARGDWVSRSDVDFLFRRDQKREERPVEHS